MTNRSPQRCARSCAAIFVTAVMIVALGPVAWSARHRTLVFGQTTAPTGATTTATTQPSPEDLASAGLILELWPQGQSGAADVRTARLVALHVPSGTPASSMFPPGPFTATWRGAIKLPIRDRYAFNAQGRGSIKVTINDEVVLEATGEDLSTVTSERVRLKKGENPIVVEYTSPPDGEATVRLYWSAREFPPEPVPPTLFVHDPSDATLAQGQQVHAGRMRMATLRCLSCHTPGDAIDLSSNPMPELAIDAPDLREIGGRLNGSWMAHWISDPKHLRPDASMPKLFHLATDGVADEARHIAAYLGTLGDASEDVTFTDADAGEGGHLFLRLGCVACHTAPDAMDAGAFPDRVPLKYVRSKWKPSALVRYLKSPQQHYRWTRMPDFRLSDDEARQLAAYLHGRAPENALPDVSGGDIEQGRRLLTSAGCLSCHNGPDQNAFVAPPLAQLRASGFSNGCLADDPAHREGAPDFGFDDADRSAIRTFASTDLASLGRTVTTEFASRQTEALNCNACHQIDAQPDRWTILTDEIAAIRATLPYKPPIVGEGGYSPDQSRPRLTWVGEKLKPETLRNAIAGTLPYKPRPWLEARMPGFPTHAELLAEGLAKQHGFAPSDERSSHVDPELATIGRRLVGRDGAFQCNACHAIGEVPASAAFEAPAPNFSHVRDRIRKHYYDRWIRNPQRVEPGTRMPQFADMDALTALRHTFDGNGPKQFEAIWHYLQAGERIEPP